MLVKSSIRKLWSDIQAYRRSVFIVFETWCLLFLWVIDPFATAGIALIAALIATVIVSLMFIPIISQIHSFLKEKDLYDVTAFGILAYGTGYLLTLYLAIELLQKIIDTFNVTEVKSVQFALQTIAFVLYIILFCLFRNPKQQQYWAYALVYGGSLIWEWGNNWGVTSNSFLGMDTDFALKFFIEPFKEAMLLFIILDTFFKARDELKQEKRL